MADPAITTLDYGGIATRRGVVCDWRADGTLVINIPRRNWFETARADPESWIMSPLIRLLFTPWTYFTKPKPLAVIELSRDELAVTEDVEGSMYRRAWPRAEIAELRPNRYGSGLYMRIPGKENTDLLQYLDAELIKWLGDVLEQAMQAHRASTS